MIASLISFFPQTCAIPLAGRPQYHPLFALACDRAGVREVMCEKESGLRSSSRFVCVVFVLNSTCVRFWGDTDLFQQDFSAESAQFPKTQLDYGNIVFTRGGSWASAISDLRNTPKDFPPLHKLGERDSSFMHVLKQAFRVRGGLETRLNPFACMLRVIGSFCR